MTKTSDDSLFAQRTARRHNSAESAARTSVAVAKPPSCRTTIGLEPGISIIHRRRLGDE